MPATTGDPFHPRTIRPRRLSFSKATLDQFPSAHSRGGGTGLLQ